ncbi:MAG: hypothetical protein IPN17_08835 [Deltaproteobacteria bacterium]|nr:hypothetical protein [Deltaproteobacteria bacterium]
MSTRRLLVWPRPDAANPYLARLVGSLRARGVEVLTAPRLAALCAFPRGARWLHLHWPEWMIHHPDRRLYRARTAWLLGLLDLARARGLSIAWTAHNRIGHDDPHPDLGLAARRALLRRCSVVFGHFPAALDALSSMGFSGRFVHQPHPHFDDDYPDPFALDASARSAFRRSLGLSDDALLLVSPGSMEPYKQLPLLARALRSLDGHRFVWIPVGRASPTSSLRSAPPSATTPASSPAPASRLGSLSPPWSPPPTPRCSPTTTSSPPGAPCSPSPSAPR